MDLKEVEYIMDIKIVEIKDRDKIPYDLLILADPSIEAINEYINCGKCYAAYMQSEIIGAYVIIEKENQIYELMNIAIAEKYQGKGLGKLLVNDAIERVKHDNAVVLEVGTGNSSIDQLAFYQKCGFRIVGVLRDYFKERYEEKIIENGIECIDMILMRMEII